MTGADMVRTNNLITTTIAIAMALALVPVATMATQHGGAPPDDAGPPDGTAEQADRSQQYRNDWESLSQEKRQMGLDIAEQHRMFAQFTYSDGQADGQFVSFGFDESTGAIQDFTVHDADASHGFFDSVTTDTYANSQAPFVTGSVLHALSDSLVIRFHNNPTAVTTWTAGSGGANVTVDLADGAEAVDSPGAEVRVNVGDFHGHLLGGANVSFEVGDGQVNATMTGNSTLLFRAHASVAHAANLHDQNAAHKSDKLGAVLGVVDADGTPVEDRASVDVDAQATSISTGRVTVDVTAEVDGPRVVVITVDGQTIDPQRPEDVTVRMDGQAVSNAATAQDAIESTSAAANVVALEDVVQVTVNVPEFSTHTLDVEQAADTDSTTDGDEPTSPTTETEDETTPTPGLGAAVVLVGLLVAVAILARRRTR